MAKEEAATAAKDTEETVTAGDVEVPTKELVLSKGVSNDVWGSDSGSTFLPQLTDEMPLDVRKEAIRDAMRAVTSASGKIGLIYGEHLYEITENGYWKEWTFADESGEVRTYKDFNEYCEVELDMKKRKAYYLIEVYRKYVVELGVPAEVLRDMDWTKASALAPIVDDENWLEVIDKTKDMSVRAVKAFVKETLDKKKAADVKSDKKADETDVRMTFVFSAAQAENVQQALKYAATMAESDKPSHCMDLICSEFIAGSVGAGGLDASMMKLEVIKANLERAFGVTIKIVDVDSGRVARIEAAETARKSAESKREPAEATV